MKDYMKNNNKDALGVGRETFKIIMDSNYFPSELLHQRQLKIISTPKPKYQQWYWRGLEFLTLGRRFNAGWEYTCEKAEYNNVFSPLGGLSKKNL